MGNNDKKTLKEKAEEELKTNPSALGDPISIKAETSSLVPTEEDEGADIVKAKKPESKENPTTLGDHTSLKKERLDSDKKRDSKL